MATETSSTGISTTSVETGGAGSLGDTNSPKQWSWAAEAVSEAEQAKMAHTIATIEEAFLYKSSEEGAGIAQELTASTGYILEYSILTTDLKGDPSRSLEDEVVRGLQLPDEWRQAAQAAKRDHTGTPVGALLQSGALTPPMLLALGLYTCSGCAAKINRAMRAEKPFDVNKYVHLVANFVRGFRTLPSHWGVVYRGLALSGAELRDYKVGALVQMKGFTSASESVDVARRFAAEEAKAQATLADKRTRCLFEINSRSGRHLGAVSVWPQEKEVVFRPCTTFRVASVATVGAERWVRLDEVHPDIRGRKVLVWVDDKHALESKKIMDKSERQGVTCVHLHSTQEARAFFAENPKLLQRNPHGLRIITDMVRAESDGEQNIEAGLRLVDALATEFGYCKPILCFTGPKFLQANREKLAAKGHKHVFATARTSEAEAFAAFVPMLESEK